MDGETITIRVDQDGDPVVIVTFESDSITAEEATDLLDDMRDHISLGFRRFVFDCGPLSNVRSDLIACFVTTSKAAGPESVAVVAGDHVRRLLQITHLDSRIPAFERIDEAVREVRKV